MESVEQFHAAIKHAAGGRLSKPRINAVQELFFQVIREDLLGLTDIADMLGIELTTANMRAYRETLPPPVAKLSNGRVWFRPHVVAYIKANPKAVRHHVDQEAG